MLKKIPKRIVILLFVLSLFISLSEFLLSTTTEHISHEILVAEYELPPEPISGSEKM